MRVHENENQSATMCRPVQALAEMREKVKILQNEVEILQNESLSKDKALQKERVAHGAAQVQRDGLRLETNKAQVGGGRAVACAIAWRVRLRDVWCARRRRTR